MTNKINIVLVHGAWADGSSWSKVIPHLQQAGYNVVATQNSLNSLAEDAETTRRMAESQPGPTILVGHSYGGAVITEAAHLCPNVVGLVYIAGFGPDAGESLASLAAAGTEPPPGAAAIRPDQYGVLWIDRQMFPDNFCQDIDKTEAQVMAATQKPITVKCFEDKITHAGWKNLPAWYQVSENDKMIPPGAEHFMAERMKAKMISLPSSHVSMVSHPEEIADFILKAADELVGTAVMEASMN
ncbi:MAG: alpha/beta hydrolase [Bacteroidota bacterium]|nr:alpha/beta hydrolase [Bacteroidota bacterium]